MKLVVHIENTPVPSKYVTTYSTRMNFAFEVPFWTRVGLLFSGYLNIDLEAETISEKTKLVLASNGLNYWNEIAHDEVFYAEDFVVHEEKPKVFKTPDDVDTFLRSEVFRKWRQDNVRKYGKFFCGTAAAYRILKDGKIHLRYGTFKHSADMSAVL